ncbi:ARM repeat-containing protein [Macrolepiota fuliginosa MF-IS2]|uniref:Exportin-T n=1 Tax=Macrolepiota fuliginosa MF-IS2 TaxID=1400762 RepID=A0A9P6C0P5_9AGAR|nr:ARM repeat-containing protein [Macrolepiota fuliginosa MF-IS2]
MSSEIEQIAQAIAIASDPSQSSLHQQALQFISTIQQNASETWRLALPIFVNRDPEGRKSYTPQTRFFALRVLDEFLDNRFDPLDDESFNTIQQSLMSYVQTEYVGGPAESDAPFLRNKFSHTLTLFFLCTYINQWPSFFTDLFTLIRSTVPDGTTAPTTSFNRHVCLLFFHVVLEISGEVADQTIKAARSWNITRHQRDGRVRDAVREQDAAKVNEAVLLIISEAAERMVQLRKMEGEDAKRGLDAAVEIVDWGIRTFGSYVGWIDINLTVTPTTVNLMFGMLADNSLPIRLATSLAILRIVSKGLKEPGDKLQLIKVLSLGQVLEALEAKTRQQQIDRGDDTDEGEESYREALGRMLNVLGLELTKLIEEPGTEEVCSEATSYLEQVLPVMLRFMADEYDDTASTIFPLLQVVLASYKRDRRSTTEPLSESRRSFLTSLLQVILAKLKWEERSDPDDSDDDDVVEFDKMRKDLRTFLDSVLATDQDLATGAVQSLAMHTISLFRNGIPLKWNDAELGVYLVFIFGEINKSGGKGRAAFCHAPPIDKTAKVKPVLDYSEFPLTSHGEMLLALVQSGIASYPNKHVALQYFETVARYTDFFKVRKECILPTLEAMIDARGLHSDDQCFRSRLYYLFYKFIKEDRQEIPPDLSAHIIDSMRDLLPITVEIPELEEGETDILGEIIRSANFDSQLYLFETTGILTSLTFKTPERQASLLLSLVKPLMDDLSTNLQMYRERGANPEDMNDMIPIAKVHHIIMALGNIAKGFPDYPTVIPENYIMPPLEVFLEVAKAILVCLEAMNVFKIVRDATRFAFARILATAGPTVASYIPPLMGNLLAHFEPSELVDFMNFIGLLIFRLNKDLFDVLDQLIGPLNLHITSLLSQPISGTDDERAHIETKKAYLALLNNILAAKLQGIFTSERNSSNFEPLLESMLGLAEDASDPSSQKAAFVFFNKCVICWGKPIVEDVSDQEGLPGFDRFIYERIVPLAFRVPSSPSFNLKDGQVVVALQEICHLLQAIIHTRGQEAYTFFLSAFLPSQNWPTETALEFVTKMQSTDPKIFRKYFTDLIRSSRRIS